MKSLAILGVFGLLFLLRLGSYGVVDYDEGCYAEVSREMVLHGDLLNPFLNGQPFYEKPPLLYWVQVAGYRLFGVGPWGARFGNALAALATLLALYHFSRRSLGERAALLATGILGTAFLFVALGRVVLTDMLLMLWFVAALGCLHRAFEKAPASATAGTGWFLAASVAVGLAMLTKGAIGVLFPAGAGVVTLLLTGKPRLLLRPSWLLPGLLIMFALGFSWYLLLGFTHPDGFAFMGELFMEHHVGRFTDPMQGHSGPVWYYLPVLLFGFLPWSCFLPQALRRMRWRGLDDEADRYLLLFGVFSIAVFLFFSLAATKLPNYIAVTLPGFALLTGRLLAEPEQTPRERGWRWAAWAAAGLYLLLALLLAAAPTVVRLLPHILGEKALKAPGLATPVALGAGPYLGAVAALAAGLLVLRRARRQHAAGMAWTMVIGSLALSLVLLQFIMPRYDQHFAAPLARVARAAADYTQPGERVVLVGLRHRPSVVFYAGRYTEYCSRRDRAALLKFFGGADARVGITTAHHLSQFADLIPHEVLAQDTGYVLFRSPAAR